MLVYNWHGTYLTGLKMILSLSTRFQIVIPDLCHAHLAEADVFLVFLDHVGFSLVSTLEPS